MVLLVHSTKQTADPNIITKVPHGKKTTKSKYILSICKVIYAMLWTVHL